MYSSMLWLMMTLILGNLVLAALIVSKILKLEKFQTGEAQANLELINQSLNRLSQITEMLEATSRPMKNAEMTMAESDIGGDGVNKERRAVSLLRRGENPRLISKKLGISRSEMELLVASEKLGSGRKSAMTSMAE
jgi:hypothetical protein